jgi:hypothetical protein
MTWKNKVARPTSNQERCMQLAMMKSRPAVAAATWALHRKNEAGTNIKGRMKKKNEIQQRPRFKMQ